jgi:DeoR/GlpR family transcriptional regulator of sugar metabolism
MPRYDIRRTVSSPARTAIAKAAAKLARNGQVIFMDSGTTMLEVARYLPERLTATVVTTSPPVAVALADHPSVSVIMVGGRLDKTSMIASGAETVQALSRIRADLCFLGVCSLHPVIGVSEENYDESLVKRAMITHSAEVAALASAEKLGNAQPFVVAPIKDLTYLVTDMAAPEETLAAFRAAGITILQS